MLTINELLYEELKAICNLVKRSDPILQIFMRLRNSHRKICFTIHTNKMQYPIEIGYRLKV